MLSVNGFIAVNGIVHLKAYVNLSYYGTKTITSSKNSSLLKEKRRIKDETGTSITFIVSVLEMPFAYFIIHLCCPKVTLKLITYPMLFNDDWVVHNNDDEIVLIVVLIGY